MFTGSIHQKKNLTWSNIFESTLLRQEAEEKALRHRLELKEEIMMDENTAPLGRSSILHGSGLEGQPQHV